MMCLSDVAGARVLLTRILSTYTSDANVWEGQWEPIALVLYKAIGDTPGLTTAFPQLLPLNW